MGDAKPYCWVHDCDLVAGACPACADEPVDVAGVVLPPPASGNAQEWRDLCTAQSAEIEALRTSLERALGRIASLSAERDGFRAAAEQHAAERQKQIVEMSEEADRRRLAYIDRLVRPPLATIEQMVNSRASVLPGRITYIHHPRLSAAWEHLPCVTEGARPPVAAVDPLFRAIGARPRPVGLLTERVV